MAVTAIPLTTGSSTANASSYTTDSITPTANRLVLVAVLATVGSGSTTVALSGCGLNWVKVDQTPDAARTVHVFRARGSAPTSGPLTMTGGSQMTSALWQVTEFNGADTSGTDGSGAIVQSVNARPGSATSVNVAFNLSVDPANATHGAVGVATQEAPVVGGAPWTPLGSTTQSAPTSGLLAEFAPTAVQDVAASWSTAAASFVVGVEIKAAATAGTPTGAASGSWGFAVFPGLAVGTANYIGTASGSWLFTGAAQGGNAPAGTASGAWSFTGSTAVGTSARSGTAAGSWGFTGSATGAIAKTGSASGTWGFTGSAVGSAPVVPGTSHTYGYATLIAATAGTATLIAVPVATATLVGTPVSTTSLGGFGRDFGLNFGVVTVAEAASFSVANGASAAILISASPALAVLQLI